MKYKLIKEYPGSPKLNTKVFLELENNYTTNLINDFNLYPINLIENYPEFWEKVVEKDYKILSLARFCSIKPTITDVSDYGDGYIEALLKCDKARVHSVKRLSDSEVFTIGDNTNHGKILNIYFGENITFHCDKDDEDPWLEDLKHIKQPLFTTEDGVDIFEGDDFYYVKFIQYNMTMGKPFEIVKGNHPTFKYEPQFEKYFSTKETAEEYILMNKPCLSLNDIFKDVEEMRKGLKTFENSQLAKRFKKLVQQKLKL